MSTEAKPETETTPDLPDAKPPFLKRVRIRNYKSIAFCDVSLEPLTILVGRNASGKSNFLDALGFLADLMDKKATDAVREHGGWRSVLCRAGSSQNVEFEIEVSFGSDAAPWIAEYAFVLAEGSNYQIRVLRERVEIHHRDRSGGIGFELCDGKMAILGHGGRPVWGAVVSFDETGDIKPDDTYSTPDANRNTLQERLRLGIASHPFLGLAEELRASAVYNFSPPAIREIQMLTTSPVLAHNGHNLARAIEALREIDPSEIERVGQFLSSIVPEIDSFETIPYGTEHETIQFNVASHPGAEPQQFLASNMSDGTLRVLASLIASRQIYLPTNASGFIGIEEPETALHPDAMMALVEALDEATLTKQILLTTHSPDLLDVYSVKPENVRVVEMIDGETVIGGVDEASLEIIKRKLSTLGGLERQKSLVPNYDDVDRQRRLKLNGQGHVA